jgi:hypothetical protein
VGGGVDVLGEARFQATQGGQSGSKDGEVYGWGFGYGGRLQSVYVGPVGVEADELVVVVNSVDGGAGDVKCGAFTVGKYGDCRGVVVCEGAPQVKWLLRF